MFKKLSFHIIPVQIFLGIFWFKIGFIDKVCGIFNGLISPETAYHGDTWAGWKEYIVGTWDKSQVAHVALSPLFDALFPVLIILQCLPFLFIIYLAVVNNLPIEYLSLLDEKRGSFMKKINNEFGLYDIFNIIRKDNKKFKPPIFEDGQDIVILL